MAVKKIAWVLLPLVIISLVIIFFSSSLLPLPIFSGKSVTTQDIAGSVYYENFDKWRDNTTDPGFNAWVRVSRGKLTIFTKKSAYGKAMSNKEPIILSLTPETEMVIRVSRIDHAAIGTVRVINAYEPYDAYQVAGIREPGAFQVKLREITGWEGDTSLWIEVWLEGRRKKMTLREIYVTDPAIARKQRKIAAMKKYISQTFTPIPKNSIFFEDFRLGTGAWRTGETDPGFKTELNFEKGAPRLKLSSEAGGGKMMSAAAGIRTEITPFTQLEIVMGDMGTSRIKVDLMMTKAPFKAYTIIPWVDKPGKYIAQVSEKTSWEGSQVFWIQIWLETTTDPKTETGAVIKRIRILEQSQRSGKNQTANN